MLPWVVATVWDLPWWCPDAGRSCTLQWHVLARQHATVSWHLERWHHECTLDGMLMPC